MRLGISGHRGLPEASEKLVRAALGAVVERYDAGSLVGVRCLAEGPDTWFAEAVLDHGGRVEAVHEGGGEALVGAVDRLLAVWDGRPAPEYGETANVVAYAERTGVPILVIWPDGATRD
ncbi:hypothetical protein [Streptomyces sp. NPDC051569]|uniref:hypothetical protein n=1 Tax=Streptomyces sp. NPDC051569 TaxID=3365661 RepID=UPI0037A27271